MKLLLNLFLFLLLSGMVYAQNIRFTNNSDVTKVLNGTTVRIEVDTAYVIGKIKAEFLNQKIKELNEIKVLYNIAAENHNKLLDDLNKVQDLLEKFRDKAITDSMAISENFNRVLVELSKSLNDIKINNELLKKNNSELKSQLEQLDKIVKQLKKETRGIWWNGVADKIVAFAGGVGVGVLLVTLL